MLPALCAVFGAVVGSFLNVCIYRLPRDLSVRKPARSFCPQCKKTISWWENLPILSWILLRGRCSGCKAPIPARYPLVEALTALLFWTAATHITPHNLGLLPAYFTLLAILIVATFVDLEHMIIPDEVTWGGVFAGAFFSAITPSLHGDTSWLRALCSSLLGAGVGYAILWLVVELGRLAFGKKRSVFASPTDLIWVRNGEEATLTVAEDVCPWSDFFYRGNEQIRMGVIAGEVDGRPVAKGEFVWNLNTISSGSESWDLNRIDKIRLQIEWIVLPREAMGFGDVKFLAALGAFIGWKGALFSVVAASGLGAVLGLALSILRNRKGAAIPFGPYLAVGALLWVLCGPQLVAWYWGVFRF